MRALPKPDLEFDAAAETLLTPDEFAGMLRIGPRTLRRLIAAGEAPAPVYFGRAARWSRRRVERWLKEREA